jgi:Na+-translocating ferredoxin:NAD+ oxidoreductase RnfC subunit
MSEAANIARECGIVGAGGAGFPTHVKLQARVDTLLVNAAECEPLLYKDQEILENFLPTFAEGTLMAAEAVGATRVAVGIKEKHGALLERLRDELPSPIEVMPLKDAYPSGDEFVLAYEMTGRSIPKGGIPLDAGVLVHNVETLYNLGRREPLTEKFLTVSGDVPDTVTFKVPIGASLREVLHAAGAPTQERGFVVGGPMMGTVTTDLDEPVTKTTAGVLVLPQGHSLLARKGRTTRDVHKIATACDQCMRCTDLCPRDLLGHGVKPHRAMISIGFSPEEATAWQETALSCCECALCTLYACPEELDPFRVMVESKRKLYAQWRRPSKEAVEPHPMYPYRRTPTPMLIRRLGLDPYMAPHRYAEISLKPKRLVLPLKQHAGAPSIPAVKKGQAVRPGGLLAEIPEGALGSRILAPLAGTVSAVEPHRIILDIQ